MRQLFYQIIYHPGVNKVLRNLNKLLEPLLPSFVKLPPSGVLSVRLKTGSFKFSTNQTNTTSHLLFWNGPYEMEYTAIFEDLIKKCNCFYDIGAHAGYYSLVAAAVNPKIKAIAFEPAEGPYHYLAENIRINQFEDQIIPIESAVGSSDGKADFLEVVHSKYRFLKYNLVAVSNLSSVQPHREMKRTQVPITTLDHFVEKHSEMLPDIVKMDTEGTENRILEAARRTLQHQPIVICETLFNKIEAELENIMKGHQYEFFNFKKGKLIQVHSIIRSTDDGVHDCFFVHPNKRHLIEAYIDKPRT